MWGQLRITFQFKIMNNVCGAVGTRNENGVLSSWPMILLLRHLVPWQTHSQDCLEGAGLLIGDRIVERGQDCWEGTGLLRGDRIVEMGQDCWEGDRMGQDCWEGTGLLRGDRIVEMGQDCWEGTGLLRGGRIAERVGGGGGGGLWWNERYQTLLLTILIVDRTYFSSRGTLALALALALALDCCCIYILLPFPKFWSHKMVHSNYGAFCPCTYLD